MTYHVEEQDNNRPRLPGSFSARRLGSVIAILVILVIALWAIFRPVPEPLPDFSGIERADVLKTSFFGFLAPIVMSENERVLEQRQRLLDLLGHMQSERGLSNGDRHWLEELATEYEVEWPGQSEQETLTLLKRRVDVVPESLALVQAAKESAWGRSRFAREGNNLFGHWCYVEGCGITPLQRNENAVHEVAAFKSVRQSVRRYMNNLNTHDAYQPLRELRETQRESGLLPQALTLADGLVFYSERREAYVEDIKQIIRANSGLINQAVNQARTSEQSITTATGD